MLIKVKSKTTDKMKTVRTLDQIKADERISEVIPNWDGRRGLYHVSCKNGYSFDLVGSRTVEIGSLSQVCDAINYDLRIDNK